MSSLYNSVHRMWTSFNPPSVPKQSNSVRIGLIGASNIAPMAIISPAKAHPEVIIAAVAARDPQKAQAFAKKHSIPIVHSSYQALLDDPAIDAVYISLPNFLHYEWAVKAIEAGKHILLEKPSCANVTETSKLFSHSKISPLGSERQIIVLEAFHNRFHPSFQFFLSLCHSNDSKASIAKVTATSYMHKGYLSSDDIRLNSTLGGGCLMDLGTYPLSLVRLILSPPSTTPSTPKPILISATAEKAPDPKIDLAINASWNFPTPTSTDETNTATGEISCSLQATGVYSILPKWLNALLPRLELPKCIVEFQEVLAPEPSMELKEGEQHFVRKTLAFYNFLLPHMWHRIDISETHEIRMKAARNDEAGRVVKTWTKMESRKAYDWPEELRDGGNVRKGEMWWSTYSYQLEEFVNRIKGREGSGVWVSGEDSVEQMAMIDGVYEMVGLGVRGEGF